MPGKIETVIMGGTFDPVHIGHMHLADEVYRQFRPELFLIIPSFISAHKRGDDAVSAEHRVNMLDIACRDTEFTVETCEIDREGVSYTIDTVRYLKEKYSLNAPPGLVIGDDLVAGFHLWKECDALAAESNLIVACRNDAELSGFGYKHVTVENLKLSISSSDIRLRLREGRAARYLLPAGVHEYILNNRLYGV